VAIVAVTNFRNCRRKSFMAPRLSQFADVAAFEALGISQEGLDDKTRLSQSLRFFDGAW
jgi:hypothetical protein